MAGRASWALLGALALIAVAPPMGCTDGGSQATPTPLDGPVTIADVLADAGPRALLPALQTFRTDATALSTALADWQAALDSGTASAELDAARDAWATAMASWQVLEVMQMGPVASSLTAEGGEDLRDEVYSWPTVNACRVDQETAEEAWDDAAYFDDNLVNSYGLDAIEHLLFAPPTGNICPPQVPMNSDGTWDALGESGIARNRAAFALALTDHVIATTDRIEQRWSAFSLADLGEQEGLNAVYDAIFYLETGTKDRKLAEPLGLRDCTSDCEKLFEHPLSGVSTDAIVANLQGFRMLFTAGDGAGMEDLLRANGHEAIADQMLASLDASEAAAAAMSGPLQDDLPGATALHDAIREGTLLLKGDLATVLALQIPQEASGDND